MALMAGCSGGTQDATSGNGSSGGQGAADGTVSTTLSPTDDTAVDAAVDPAIAPEALELLCDAAARIRSIDNESDAVTAELSRAAMTGDVAAAAAEFPRVVARLEALLPRIEAAYDDLEAALPDELGQKAAEVRELTVALMAAMSSAESLEVFGDAFTRLGTEAAESAGAAARELDRITTRECDISIAE